MKYLILALALTGCANHGPSMVSEASASTPKHESSADKLDRIEKKLDAYLADRDRSRTQMRDYKACENDCDKRFDWTLHVEDTTEEDRQFNRDRIQCFSKCQLPDDAAPSGC